MPSGKRVVIFCERQTGDPPFSPRMAIKMFASICRERGITRVRMGHYAGQLQRAEWEEEGIGCDVVLLSAHELYVRLEPMINNGAVAFCDSPRLVRNAVPDEFPDRLCLAGNRGDQGPRFVRSSFAGGCIWVARFTAVVVSFFGARISLKPNRTSGFQRNLQQLVQ